MPEAIETQADLAAVEEALSAARRSLQSTSDPAEVRRLSEDVAELERAAAQHRQARAETERQRRCARCGRTGELGAGDLFAGGEAISWAGCQVTTSAQSRWCATCLAAPGEPRRSAHRRRRNG